MKRLLLRLAIGAWIGLGVLAVRLAPEDEPLAPELAEALYGTTRSMQSSAPEGALALARTLSLLGFEVSANQRVGWPEAEVLVVLSPPGLLDAFEIESLLGWVRAGGRLIYAGRDLSVRATSGEPSAEAKPVEITVEDPLIVAVQQAASGVQPKGGAALYAVGTGLVALVDGAGEALSNRRLREVGLGAELPWLRIVLEGASRVAFDEGRIGAAPQEGLIDALLASRYAPALRLSLLALLLWLVAVGVRRMPAEPEGPAGGRAFGEHLSSVGHVMRSSSRAKLAHQLLLQGTRRRLGALAGTPLARAVLEAHGAPPDEAGLVAAALALRRLEREMGLRSEA